MAKRIGCSVGYEMFRGKCVRKTKKPKYVALYFTDGINVSKSVVMKRLKHLEDSRWGYKTSEYKDLNRYKELLKNQDFSKRKYYNRKKRGN